MNGGIPFKFIKKYSPEELATVKDWVEKTLANLA